VARVTVTVRGAAGIPWRGGHDAERLELGQPMDGLLTESLTEVLEVPGGTQVGEGQHGDGVLARERRPE